MNTRILRSVPCCPPLLILMLCLLSTAATGQTLRVGGGEPGCTHTSLQAAIDAAPNGATILVTRSGSYTGQTFQLFNKGLTLIGGYQDCNSALPSGRTTLNANGANAPVFDIYQPPGEPNTRFVRLENLSLLGANGSNARGATVEGPPGRLRVTFANVEVANNHNTGGVDPDGGGIAVLANGTPCCDALLTLDNNTEITSNSAAGAGGGLSCSGNAALSSTVVRIGNALISGNTAARGGGVAVLGCHEVLMHTGGPSTLGIPSGGIVGNQATQQGGGVHVSNGSKLLLRGGQTTSGLGHSPVHAALLEANSAPRGGGAYVTGSGSVLDLEDTLVLANSASEFGGGVFVSSQGQLRVDRPTLEACLPTQTGALGFRFEPPCNRIEGNQVSNPSPSFDTYGGAVYLDQNADAQVTAAIVRGNSARFGSAVAVTGGTVGTAFSGHSLLFTGNSGASVFDAFDRATVSLIGATVADNVHPASPNTLSVADLASVSTGATARFNVRLSILRQAPTHTLVRQLIGTTESLAECVIGSRSSAQSGFDSLGFYSDIDPGFFNAAAGDYRLGIESPAIDYCDNGFGGSPLDLNRRSRNLAFLGPPRPQAPGAVPGSHFWDLGAFEAVRADVALTVGGDGECSHATLQAAIDAAGDGMHILIARNGNYLGQNHSVNGKALTLRGGFNNCNSLNVPSGRSTLDANGSLGPVLDVRHEANSSAAEKRVTLRDLELRRGGGPVGHGARVLGRPGKLAVEFQNVIVENNAASGIGVYTSAPRAGALFDPLAFVSANSVLRNNQAALGGGLYCEDTHSATGQLVLLASRQIHGNSAQGGGGLASRGCRGVYVTSDGNSAASGIFDNSASGYGGGVLVEQGGQVFVTGAGFFALGDPTLAARLVDNQAQFGGGAALLDAGSELWLIDTRVIDNQAGEDGGGVFVGEGAALRMQRADNTPCSGGFGRCSELSRNTSQRGGALALADGGTADLQRTLVQGNRADIWGSAAYISHFSSNAATPRSRLSGEGLLVSGNEGPEVFRLRSQAELQLAFSTVTDNRHIPPSNTVIGVVRMDAVPSASPLASINASILWQRSGDSLMQRLGSTTGTMAADCVIGSLPAAQSGFDALPFYSNNDPRFLNPASGNYRLANNSPAIDYCSAQGPQPQTTDLDGRGRGQTWGGPPPPPADNPDPGPFDLGAYEGDHDDVIFANGFQ